MDDVWRDPPLRVYRRERPPELAFVLPTLAIGEYPRAEDVAWLAREHAVGAIISLQDDDDLRAHAVDLAAVRRAAATVGIELHRFPVPDCRPEVLIAIVDRLIAVMDDLERRGVRVYLHCNAGLNRAPTAAIAYLHVRHGLSLRDACAAVKAQRACGPYMQLLVERFGDGA